MPPLIYPFSLSPFSFSLLIFSVKVNTPKETGGNRYPTKRYPLPPINYYNIVIFLIENPPNAAIGYKESKVLLVIFSSSGRQHPPPQKQLFQPSQIKSTLLLRFQQAVQLNTLLYGLLNKLCFLVYIICQSLSLQCHQLIEIVCTDICFIILCFIKMFCNQFNAICNYSISCLFIQITISNTQISCLVTIFKC